MIYFNKNAKTGVNPALLKTPARGILAIKATSGSIEVNASVSIASINNSLPNTTLFSLMLYVAITLYPS